MPLASIHRLHGPRLLLALPCATPRRKAEDQYLALYNTLENLLASERQQRLRAAREAMAAQQESNALAAEVVHDRVAELLGRVSAEEEAILARHSVGTRPEKKAELVGQIRRLLGLN